jgi:hypothetical protein
MRHRILKAVLVGGDAARFGDGHDQSTELEDSSKSAPGVPSQDVRELGAVTGSQFDCSKTVPKPNQFSLFGMALSKKQIPQIVENI